MPEPGNSLYRAGSEVALTCNAVGGFLPLTYSWNSTCMGECFVLGQSSQIVTTGVLHSRDSGTHVCQVTDYAGHSGSATVNVSVVGKWYCTCKCGKMSSSDIAQ